MDCRGCKGATRLSRSLMGTSGCGNWADWANWRIPRLGASAAAAGTRSLSGRLYLCLLHRDFPLASATSFLSSALAVRTCHPVSVSLCLEFASLRLASPARLPRSPLLQYPS